MSESIPRHLLPVSKLMEEGAPIHGWPKECITKEQKAAYSAKLDAQAALSAKKVAIQRQQDIKDGKIFLLKPCKRKDFLTKEGVSIERDEDCWDPDLIELTFYEGKKELEMILGGQYEPASIDLNKSEFKRLIDKLTEVYNEMPDE